jgi:Arc/MetJ-type ribon-helix-helix transcriptional regulator
MKKKSNSREKKENHFPISLPVKVTEAQFEKVNEYENRSEYVRYLIQADIEKDWKI